MHPGGMRSAMELFVCEKSANLKHPSGQLPSQNSMDCQTHVWSGPMGELLTSADHNWV